MGLLAAAAAAAAQPLPAASSVMVALENDFLNTRGVGTDRYYTSGVRIEYFFTKEKARFPSSLLVRVGQDKNLYSWGAAQYMFTPAHIERAEAQVGDRPYAGALFAVHTLHSFDPAHRLRLSSEIFFGVMGPLSFAEQTQKWVHEKIRSPRPEGWDHQVPNDVILNYNIQVEKQLVFVPRKIQVAGLIETFNGTLYNAMDAGFTMKVGRFRNDLQEEEDPAAGSRKKGHQLFVFMKPVVRVVYSNALLQGGLITNLRSDSESYTLHKDQLERINAFYEVGVAWQHRGLGIAVMQKLRTAEFKGGAAQEVGNLTLQLKL